MTIDTLQKKILYEIKLSAKRIYEIRMYKNNFFFSGNAMALCVSLLNVVLTVCLSLIKKDQK